MKKTRIAILGIGGVGGFIGGLLAKKYSGSSDVEIIFIARGENQKAIREKGLKIITNSSEMIVFPNLVSDDPKAIKELDLLICTVKGYDLETSLIRYKNCITEATAILQLLNGVDASEKIKKIFPKANIIEGCVYIIARKEEPGVIKESGDGHTLYFGSKNSSDSKLENFEKILKDAGINSRLHKNIETKIWEKFIFISCLASLTSFLGLPVGAIMADQQHKKTMTALLKEIKAIADAKGIQLPEDIIPNLVTHMEKLDYNSTSSMHDDFKKGGKTEYRSLTAYVVLLGDELGIATPEFDRVSAGLIDKMKSR